jgi:hypothetical protein
MMGFVTGSVLLVLALAPGLWASLLHDVEHGVRNIRESLFFSDPVRVHQDRDTDERRDGRAPMWMAAIGVLLIVLSFSAYLE